MIHFEVMILKLLKILAIYACSYPSACVGAHSTCLYNYSVQMWNRKIKPQCCIGIVQGNIWGVKYASPIYFIYVNNVCLCYSLSQDFYGTPAHLLAPSVHECMLLLLLANLSVCVCVFVFLCLSVFRSAVHSLCFKDTRKSVEPKLQRHSSA